MIKVLVIYMMRLRSCIGLVQALLHRAGPKVYRGQTVAPHQWGGLITLGRRRPCLRTVMPCHVVVLHLHASTSAPCRWIYMRCRNVEVDANAAQCEWLVVRGVVVMCPRPSNDTRYLDLGVPTIRGTRRL